MSPLVIVVLIVIILIATLGAAAYLGVFSSSGTSASTPSSGISVIDSPPIPTPDAPSVDKSTETPAAPAPVTPPPPVVVPQAAAAVPQPPDCASDPSGYYYFYSPDVKAAGMDAKVHWDSYGYKEGRKSCWAPPAWKMTPGTAYYLGGLQKNQIIAQDANTTPDTCKTKCTSINGCKGFFYQERGALNGGGYNFPNKSCVYTNVPLWGGAAGQSDSYYLP